MDSAIPFDPNNLHESFEDFFEHSLGGYIIADPKGKIIRANKKIVEWINCSTNDLTDKKFSDLLTIGGKIYYETHLGPLLRMQGFFDEVVLELSCNDRPKFKVMVNALERRDENDNICFIRYTILKASDRLQYEHNLQLAKLTAEKEIERQAELVTLREQLIAVLGHDLRNPLAAVTMATHMLSNCAPEDSNVLIGTLKRSTFRMAELINNIMDFARTRLGQGMVLSKKESNLEPVLQQVAEEMKLIYPKREIKLIYEITENINCDSNRIAQLISNLLANAFTHGYPDSPVYIKANNKNNILNLLVCNKGEPIPEDLQAQLFVPFTREDSRPSLQGLGLGLYICSEIARAHNATLGFTSSTEETCFTFKMAL